MKKFTKVCLILAAVLLLLGTGISVAAAAMGATLYDLPSIVHSGNSWDWDWDHDDWDYDDRDYDDLKEEVASVPAEIRREVSEGMEEYWNDWENFDFKEETIENIKKLDVSASGGAIQMKTSETIDKIQIKTYEGDGSCQVYVKEGTLKAKTRWNKKNHTGLWREDDPRIIIVVPKGYEFDEVDIEVNAGAFLAEEIIARELDVDVRAGSAKIVYGKVESLGGDCSAGEIVYYGYATRDVDMECAAGSMDIQLIGLERDYNYEVQANAGSVKLGDNTLSGIGNTKRFNNPDATGNMELKCSAGAITVSFHDEL